MDKNANDLLEIVIFIKDNMATKDDLVELETRLETRLETLEKKMDDGFLSVRNRIGAMDNRIDDESFKRRDLENRVRTVLPTLPLAPEHV